MNDIKAIYKFIRMYDQIAIFLALLIANFVLTLSLNITTLNLIFFIFSLMSFTFAINNISDINIDRINKKSENPIIKREVSLSFAKSFSILFLFLSVFSAFLLPNNLFYLSMFLIFLSVTYSVFIRAKSRPPLDLIYHGLSPAIVFLMISSLYMQFDFSILLFSLIVFNIFLIVQLLQEIRDFDSDRKFIKTTIIVLGKRNSFKLAIILFTSLLVTVLIGVVSSVFPVTALVYLPLAYFLFKPLYSGLKGRKNTKLLLYDFRRSLIQISIIFFILFLFLSFI